MFTGIIQHAGRVASIEPATFGSRLLIDPLGWRHRPEPGDSIAVNGCCLTVTRPVGEQDRLGFDVVSQTLAITALGRLQVGHPVNLEHAVTPNTLLGGHIVQGHVDGVGTASWSARDPANHRLRVQTPPNLMDQIVERGSIALQGVSLTVAATGPDWFEVALIPATLEVTNLGELRDGDAVNLETDYLAKLILNAVRRRESAG